MEEFFELITETPQCGDIDKIEARIPNVSLRGGLMRFGRVAENPEILAKFTNTPSMTVEQARDLVNENDIYYALPWLESLEIVADALLKINEEDIKKIKIVY